MKRDIKIPSIPDHIREVERFVETVREELSFKDDVYGNVMIAITEAVNNSIIHGNKMDESKWVFLECEALNPYRLRVTVEDQGEGFSPDLLKDPTAPENIENPGGRGVFLMTHLSDEIQFENDGRRVEMIFNI